MRTLKINNSDIVFLGDIHGNWDVILNKGLKNVNIIQVGDFGVGYLKSHDEEVSLERLSKFLLENNSFLYVIRGNHDDPSYFDGTNIFKYKNIALLEDYTVLQNDKYNILCVGGAISIDRELSKGRSRKIGRLLWWKDEPFYFDEGKLLDIVNGINLNVVVTHTTPKCFYPYQFGHLVYSFAEDDYKLIQDLTIERDLMQKMFDIVKNDNLKWFYGHFHHTYIGECEGVQARLLNIDEFYMLY